MKKIVAPLFLLILLLCIALPVFSATEYDSLRLNREDIENRLSGNTVTFIMKDTERTAKRVEINDEALNYMAQKGIKLIIETNNLTLTATPEAFKTAEWQKAVNSGEPAGVRLFIEKGNGVKVADYFDEWYYNQIGLSRYGTSAWNLSGEILVGGAKASDITKFAAPLSIKVKYPLGDGGSSENNLEMHVLNEQTEKWDYVGGSVDREERLIDFRTSVPGLYIILSNQKPQQFSDIKGHWAESDIQNMIKRNVVLVSGDKKFYPDREITRAEFAVFLVRTLGLEENAQVSKSFKDVTSDKSYYHEVLAAVNSGIVAGVGGDRFNPNVKITRQEMAVMLDRALKYAGVSAQPNQNLINKFADGKQIASWAKNSVSVTVATNLIGGRKNNSFAPKSFASRAEAVVILHRFLKIINK